MPDFLPDEVNVDDAQKYLAAYFESNDHLFDLMTRSLLRRFDVVHDPAGFARVLQLTLRPVWALRTATGSGQGTENFADTMHRSLHKIGAPLVFFPNDSRLSEIGHDILFSHHTRGKRRNVWHYKMAYLPHMFHLDEYGYSGWSALTQDSDAPKVKIPQTHIDWLFDNVIVPDRHAKISKYSQNEAVNALPERFIFLPFQIETDAVIALCFKKDYISFARELISAALDAGKTIVYKLHPWTRTNAIESMLEHFKTDRLVRTTSSIHDLLPRAEAVLTCNSGVGFEALTYLKHVLCFGQADYGSAAIEIRTIEEFFAALKAIERPVDEYKIKRLLYIAMRLHQVDVRNVDRMDRHILRVLCKYYIDRRS